MSEDESYKEEIKGQLEMTDYIVGVDVAAFPRTHDKTWTLQQPLQEIDTDTIAYLAGLRAFVPCSGSRLDPEGRIVERSYRRLYHPTWTHAARCRPRMWCCQIYSYTHCQCPCVCYRTEIW